MRVIAGMYRSRRLKSLKGPALRPTSDRLRETLFDVLGADVQDARFLDLFAGTGAVGIEALSRGASEVVFIEKHKPAAALIRRNLESLGVRAGTAVLATDVLHGLEHLAVKQKGNEVAFHLAFLDPPYAEAGAYDRVLRFLGGGSLLASNALVIAEHRKRFALPRQIGNLQCSRVLLQGDAALSFFRFKREGSSAP